MVGTVSEAIVPREGEGGERERRYGPFANNSNTRRGDGYRSRAARPSTTLFLELLVDNPWILGRKNREKNKDENQLGKLIKIKKEGFFQR